MENKTPRYVDTNEVIRIYKRWIEQLQLPEDAGALEGVQTCLDVLLEQPIVDAVPVVHAKWELRNVTGGTNGRYWCCSACDCIRSYWEYKAEDNYCFKCGAKMDLEVK
jgi:hypothetical protein